MGSQAVQRRPKVIHTGEGMRLNVRGIVFTYKAVGEDTDRRYAFTEGIVPPTTEHQSTIIVRMRRSTSSKASST